MAAETASDAAPEAIVSGSISTSFTVSVVRLLFLDPRTQMLRSSALVRKEKMRWGVVPPTASLVPRPSLQADMDLDYAKFSRSRMHPSLADIIMGTPKSTVLLAYFDGVSPLEAKEVGTTVATAISVAISVVISVTISIKLSIAVAITVGNAVELILVLRW